MNLNQTDWKKTQAALIVSRTHIYQFMKDEQVRKYNEDYYCHTFANQILLGIKLNNATFSGDILSSVVSIVKGVVEETSKQAYPTLVCGNTYAAARFGNEWQGMRMIKEAK